MIKPFSIIMIAILMGGSSCQTLKKNKNTAIGAGTGIAVGGAIGGILGKKNGNTAGGIIIGAAVGGVAGGAIGKYMDKQKRELEQELGKSATVERVGEGLKVTFDSGLLFAVNSSKLTSDMKTQLRDFAATLNEYDDTNILIDGHTDSTGSDAYNMELSEDRADAVHDYLTSVGVKRSRLGIRGFGETQPVASNDTDAGRQQNRRVEVSIWANEDLKKQAEQGKL
ncbi:MAG: OmpA family protein [Saprospiraceae bacterium]|nr:OmpA family protein [Saprospiraceae bacterium]